VNKYYLRELFTGTWVRAVARAKNATAEFDKYTKFGVRMGWPKGKKRSKQKGK